MSRDRLRTLIVDDNPADREMYRRLLAADPDMHYEIFEAECGEEGLALCGSEQIDFILLDYQLPDLDGLEFLRALRSRQAIVPLPVIMLTGAGSERVDATAMRTGAQDYLIKGSLDLPLLTRTIRHAMERHDLLTAVRDGEMRVRSILESVADSIFTFDRKGMIISANSAAEPMFGYSRSELVGKSIEFLMPELQDEVATLFASGEDPVSTIRLPQERVGCRRDGTTLPIDVTLSKFSLGDDWMFTAAARDVSHRKRMEEAHGLFLTATSHAVRNTLTTILGYTHMLKTGLAPQEADDAVTRIDNLVQNLSTLMNDVVAHADERYDRVTPQPIEIRAFLENCASEVVDASDDRGLELHAELPNECVVMTDRAALEKIILNLLNNAIRYTPSGAVSLGCEVTQAQVRFTVQDTGIGIPAEDIGRIFEDHYRHPQAMKLEPLGTGLGLATVRRLCGLLGATVSVKSTPRQGTTFTVVLERPESP